MTTARRALLVAIPLALLVFADASQADPKAPWDGTWTGSWGGQGDTSVTIAGNKVVRYVYKGEPQPIGTNRVTSTTVLFGPSSFTVVITKTGKTTAFAQYHSATSDASGNLTKQ